MDKHEKQLAQTWIQAAKEEAWKKIDHLDQEAKYGFEQVKEALECLHVEKPKEALQLLEVALEQFEIALSNHHSQEFSAIAHDVQVYEWLHKPEAVERELSYIKHLLQENKVQQARKLLSPMRCEIVSSTTYLPLNSAFESVKKSAQEIIDESPHIAIHLLEKLSEFLSIKKVIQPIPLLLAREALKNARELQAEAPNSIQQQLLIAQEQLEVAYLLGYTLKEPKKYDVLQEEIRNLIQSETEMSEAELLYDKLYNAMTEFFNSITLG